MFPRVAGYVEDFEVGAHRLRPTRQLPSVDARHANVRDQQGQTRFAAYPIETFCAILRSNDVISAIRQQFSQENADPVIIVHDDQHCAQGSIITADR